MKWSPSKDFWPSAISGQIADSKIERKTERIMKKTGTDRPLFFDDMNFLDRFVKWLPADHHVGFDDFSCLFQIGPRFVHVETDGMNLVASRF